MFENRLDHIPTKRKYSIFIAPEETPVANIKVIGVGGGGCNAINGMIERGLNGVEFIAINTDVQSLNYCKAITKIQIGASITRGLGTGGNVELGRKSAEEDREKIMKSLQDARMIFITTGLGGGTGTGASPVIASIARSTGALVVAVVTKPFSSEGKQKSQTAEKGITELREICDSIIVVPNDNIQLALKDEQISVFAGYDKPNEILYNAIRGISDVILKNGYVNVDFSDVSAILRESGEAILGIGRAKGENKVIEAFDNAVSSPLIEPIDLSKVTNLLVNFTGSELMTFSEVISAQEYIKSKANQNAFIKFGLVKDENLRDEVLVTVIATNYGKINQLTKTATFSDQAKKGEGGLVLVNEVRDPYNGIDILFHHPDEPIKYNPEDDEIYEESTFRRFKSDSNNFQKKSVDREADLLDEIKKSKDDEDHSSKFLHSLMD